MPITIYHHPRCSKSRETLELIKARGLVPQIVEYLQHPPTESELDAILHKLSVEPEDIIRTKEDVYDRLGLKSKSLSRAEMIRVLVQNPVLIERPIVVNGDRAAIGRPPENVLEIL
jgi:arsenate reductase